MRRFSKCSVAVKLQLFQTFSFYFYDIALSHNFVSGAFVKLHSVYVLFITIFLVILRFIVLL